MTSLVPTYYCSFGNQCLRTTEHCKTGKFSDGKLSHNINPRKICKNYIEGKCYKHSNVCNNFHLKIVCGLLDCKKHLNNKCSYLHPFDIGLVWYPCVYFYLFFFSSLLCYVNTFLYLCILVLLYFYTFNNCACSKLNDSI